MFDLYLIGAGFSKQVGLPLGKEFFNLHPDLYTKEKLRSIALDLID